MPYGPKGEWRPADPIAAAIHVAKLTTGEIEETYESPSGKRSDPDQARQAAAKGGEARASALTPERRSEIGKAGARARWSRRAGSKGRK